MTRKIERGNLIEELVKGSLEYTRHLLRLAFYNQFVRNSDDWFWIEDTFADHVIVGSDKLPEDEFYYVTYEAGGGSYTFAPREQWEIVELAYQPQTMVESRKDRKAGATRFTERVSASLQLIDEAKGAAKNPDGPWRIQGIGVTADRVNGNGRRYAAHVLEAAVKQAAAHLHESAGQGRLILSGEIDHPTDKGHRGPLLTETIINWQGIQFDGSQVLIEGNLLGTRAGKDTRAQMAGGIKPDISLRGYGQSVIIEEDGEEVEEVTLLYFTGFDLVTEGADDVAQVTLAESQQPEPEFIQQTIPTEEDSTVDDKEMAAQKAAELKQETKRLIEKAVDLKLKETTFGEAVRAQIKNRVLGEKPETVDLAEKSVEARVAEYQAILEEQAQRDEAAKSAQAKELAELKARETQREVNEFVEAEVKKLKYSPVLLEQFAETVKDAKPASKEAAQAVVEGLRPRFDKIQAEMALKSRGYGVEVVGPVIEQSGAPTIFVHELTEMMIRTGRYQRRDFRQPKNINEIRTAALLERFDQVYGEKLRAEAKQYEEATDTTALNLPYSVMRTVMAEAFPNLVAMSVFDFGLANGMDERIFYEVYADESATTGTVTNEDFNSGAFTTIDGISQGGWIDLANNRLVPGTVVVNVDGAGALIADDGTNYVVDYEYGRIKMLDGGSSASDVAASTAYEVDYTYKKYTQGEGAAIEQGKTSLSYVTLTMQGNRLATDITREAIVFSRSQLGYDIVTRSLANLTSQLMTKIDTDVLYRALAAVLSIASNSGGTWTASGADYADLHAKSGVAKVKVENRHYMATAFIASNTNADLMSNSDLFSAAGARADAEMDASGAVGRWKGLPLFRTSNFTDGYILCVNRELVAHRVFQPAQINGPYPKYNSDGKLIANDQYYIEEMSGTVVPLNDKGSYVKVS